MSLRISTGNMFEDVTHIWNPFKGICPFGCSYCYMKSIPQAKVPYLSGDELKTNLGRGNKIIVGTNTDYFANEFPIDWIQRVIRRCVSFSGNEYVFSTKNPELLSMVFPKDENFIACVSIESNQYYEKVMGSAPPPQERAKHMLKNHVVAIEPIMDFDLTEFVDLIKSCEPRYVYIGADSKKNGLPEPSKEKVLELIKGLESFTTVHLKKNLNRILGV